MVSRGGLGLVGVIAAAVGLSSAGCVSAEQHREALSDLQRVRVEAWQRSVESAALRVALERAYAENAQLRAAPRYATPDPTVLAMAARLEEVARRQEQIAAEVRDVPACVPAATTVQAAPQPSGRKVTDLLYSRF